MPDNVETELKLTLLRPDRYRNIWQVFCNSAYIRELAPESAWSNTAMEAWYYDTDEQTLQKAGLAYRVRREGQGFVATVKSGGSSEGGLHRRGEWNVPSPDLEPRPELFAELPVGPQLAESIGDKLLLPHFATVFDRHTLELTFEDACIEIAVDDGRILAGDYSEPIQEAELELKSGNTPALLRFAAIISREIPLVPEAKSKYYRALLLAGLTEPPLKQELQLDGQTALAEGLTKLLALTVDQLFAAYRSFINDPAEPEHTHQLRVRLRRLRSLLAFAKPCLSAEDWQAWKQIFAGWGQVFGPLRDLDVLAEHWHELCNSPYVSFDSRPWLGDTIAGRRDAYLEQVNQAIDKRCLSVDLLDFAAWLEADPWQPGEYSGTISGYARQRIGVWLKALLDAGKAANWENDQELHALRLRLKRIRYSLAAMPFFRDRRTEKLLLMAKAMQSLLGSLNDRVTTAALLSTMSRGATRAVYRDIGMLLGWHGRGELDARGQLQPQWKSLKQTARRWLDT